MNRFRFEVSLVVEAHGFDQFDAEEAIRDAFGLGEVCGLNVVESEVGSFELID